MTLGPARPVFFLTTLATMILGLAPATAHDFWIETPTFLIDRPGLIKVALRVGDNFPGDVVARNPDRIVRFVALGPEGETAISGAPGADPAGLVRLSKEGLYALGYRSNHAEVELAPAKFEHYLKEEGLDAILKHRRDNNETSEPGREIYSRCAKALVCVGPAANQPADRPLGLTLEIIAEKNPYTLAVGDELPVRLLYEGKPLADILLDARNRDEQENVQSARTNRDGRASFKITRPGFWLLAAVHMTPAPEGAAADWESVWASLSFDLPKKPS